MGRAQFEYDEVGSTFYYVLVSFYAVVLVPLTYLLWPSISKTNAHKDTDCGCPGCLEKRERKREKEGKRVVVNLILKVVVLTVLWLIFAALAYKVSTIEHVHEEYDPYHILGIDNGAPIPEVKKAYRELSKKMHPDRGGDEDTFNRIAKAYQALTNDESRENWEKYGNPDGPKATTFGIALPKWIVSDQYGGWVLAVYVGIFMVILPILVGIWWTQSMKYSADKVLLDTTRSFYHFLVKTPSMNIHRALTVLSGASEFCKRTNNEIVERITDENDVKILNKALRVPIKDAKKEVPFCMPWSIKTRVYLAAYLSRETAPSKEAREDQVYFLTKIMVLTEEFIRMHLQMYFYIPVQRQPTLETLETIMRLQPLFVQALWPHNSTLLQLPHVDDYVQYLQRRRVFKCADLARLNEFRRRELLKDLTDEQYHDVVTVLSQMPKIDVVTQVEVKGEDDKHTVTAGALVTLHVTLRRSPLLDPERRKQELVEGPKEKEKDERDEKDESQQPLKQRKVWEKPEKKKKNAGAKPKKGRPPPKKKPAAAPVCGSGASGSTGDAPSTPAEPIENGSVEHSESGGESDSESEGSGGEDEATNNATSNQEDSDEDDDLWEDGMARKEALLDKEPTDHHLVHAPYFVSDKYEWWYVYLVDKKTRHLVSYVVPCKTLNTVKTVDIRLTAPDQKGTYTFTLHVRSDAYLDVDETVDVRLDVLPAPEPVQVKYADTEDEEEGADADDISEYTEGSDSDDED